jgi:hypothetical protein
MYVYLYICGHVFVCVCVYIYIFTPQNIWWIGNDAVNYIDGSHNLSTILKLIYSVNDSFFKEQPPVKVGPILNEQNLFQRVPSRVYRIHSQEVQYYRS